MQRKQKITVICGLILASQMVSAQVQNGTGAESVALATANNQFGIKVFQTMCAQNAHTNLLLSPTSVAQALEMTWSGANGDTASAMAKALQLTNMSKAQVGSASGSYLKALNSGDPATELKVANSLWIGKSTPIRPEFVASTRQNYNAEIGDLAGAPNNVNAWVNKNTNGKITSILSRNDVSKHLMGAVLVNTVYFKGAWMNAFNPVATHPDQFNHPDGTHSTCNMMSENKRLPYLKGDGFQMVALPYQGTRGSHIKMLLLLPDKASDLKSLSMRLSDSRLREWDRKLSPVQCNLKLPKFKFESDMSLQEPLTALGMGVAFDLARADFSRMSTSHLYISKVKHKTFIDLDEKGTEAAAATAVVMNRGGMRSVQPTEVVFNRPFLTMIEDTDTGAVLFLGMVYDPAAS